MKTLTAIAGTAVLAAASFAGTAFAEQAHTEEVVMYVSASTDVLDAEAGAEAYAELERKATRACMRTGVRGLAAVDQVCVEQMVETAVAELRAKASQFAEAE